MAAGMRSNARQIAVDLAKYNAATHKRIRQVVTVHGAILQRGVKARARQPRSGPVGPEPRIITGNYNRSINRRTTHTAHVSVATVGTNAPQGRRLEFGFNGVDSLGRNYDQPALPHFGPALDEVEPMFAAAVAAATTPGVGR